MAPIAHAGSGDLGVLLSARYVADALVAMERGALLLIDASVDALLAKRGGLPGWVHPHAAWAMAELLDDADHGPSEAEPIIGPGCRIGPGAQVLPGVRLGARVTIGPGTVVGIAGFGHATGEGGAVRPIPQLGGVVIEDDVHIGALSTIACGTLGPTILRRGARLDAQVHVGHNCEIGPETLIAAQCGFAGSVTIGAGVLIGGQVGIADHVRIGAGARIAAKSGVIGDVPEGVTVGGYPAVERRRWLRGLAELYRRRERGSGKRPRPSFDDVGAPS